MTAPERRRDKLNAPLASQEDQLWEKSRSGALAGRGFRFQDAAAAWLLASAWQGHAPWTSVIPEGLDDITLHGEGYECRVQVKSRRDPQSSFSINEAAAYIAEAAAKLPRDWRTTSDLRIALLLERQIHGLQETGWQSNLGDAIGADALREALTAKLDGAGEQSLRDLFARIHLIIEAEPLERGLDALTSATGPQALERLAMHGLREQVGQAADANAAKEISKRIELGRSDVQRQLDQVQGLIDPDGYLKLTSGLCEIAEFDQSVSEEEFRDGINVQPGHVGAGLVFDRQDTTEKVLEAISTKRFALVAGPSGAGKSAVAWLAAHATRHEIRWYRVRRLTFEDVARLVRLARALDATPHRPIGFVVDDIGHSDTAGWDAFVQELGTLPGAIAIATVREEDLLVLATAARSVVIRPKLDETLAERIWSSLNAAGKSAFSFWREPYERSRGLLLEYIHLLSKGRRLQETLSEQVRRRLAEDRGDELLLLRTIAFAATRGGTVDAGRLRVQLGFGEPQFAKALRRLIDEHAVRQRGDGTLTGLHEIRSAYLDEAVRDILGTSRSEVLGSAIDTVTGDSIATFLAHVMREWPEEDDTLFPALAHRLTDPTARVWIGIFHGLGLVTTDRIAAKWLEVSRAAEIEDRVSATALMLALTSTDLTDVPMFAKIKIAQAAFKEAAVSDLRARLTDIIPEGTLLPTLDLEQGHQLAAALVPLWGCTGPATQPFRFSGDLSGAPLVPLLELLRTLAALDSAVAEDVVTLAGGTEVLFERIFNETPWVTRPELGEEDGQISVTGHVRFVHPEVQEDVHADVVRLCEFMSAAAPRAKLICAQARYPDGSPAGIGDFLMADKRILRENLVLPVRVAWNRSQLRAVNRLTAAPDLTGRDTALGNAICELADKLVQAGDYYCRMKRPSAKWQVFLTLRSWLTDFIQPALVDDAVGNPLDRGDWVGHDDLHAFVSGLERLLRELTAEETDRPILMAARTADLAREAAVLADPDRWRMTNRPPLDALHQIEADLWDIRAVLGDVANDPARRARMAAHYSKTSQRHNTLRRAAEDSRRRAARSLVERRLEIQGAFEHNGLTVEVISRAGAKDDGWLWLNVEFVVLLKVDFLLRFLSSEGALINSASSIPGRPKLEIAPVICGKVAPLSMIYVNNKLSPGTGLDAGWSEHLPYPVICDLDHRLFSEACDAATTLSGIGQSPGRPFNDVEQEFIDRLVGRYADRLDQLVARVEEPPDQILVETITFLAALGKQVVEEVNGEAKGASIAESIADLTRGNLNEVGQGLIVVRLALLERAAGCG